MSARPGDRGSVGSFDASVPHPARVYAYWLGGKDHYEADRKAAEEVIRLRPQVVASARANRAYLARVVRFLAAECGIRQFLDIGTGLPAPDNTHQVAQRVDARGGPGQPVAAPHRRGHPGLRPARRSRPHPPHGPPMTNPFPAAATALERLAAALDPGEFATTLTTGAGRPPRLAVASRHAQIGGDIYADHRAFWWSWSERIASVTDPPAAADKISSILRAFPAGRP